MIPATTADERGPGDWLAAFGVALLALLVRSLAYANVFHRGDVVFAPADAMYHVRRAYFTYESWPRVLLFDPYVNYPDGAPVPWPPLTDVVSGTAAVLLANDDAGFATVLAWWPAVVGALGVLPIFWIARELASRGAGIAAGSFYALLPISVIYGRVGNPDHHVAVAAIGACLLLLCVKLAQSGRGDRPARSLVVALALTRAALLLTWHGSLLYLAVVETTLLLVAAIGGRRQLYAAQALSACGTFVLIAPVLASFPTPLGGLYSSIALSRLHLIAIAGTVAVAAAGFWQMGPGRAGLRAGARGPGGRIAFLLLAGAGFSLAVLALPGPRAGLEPALRFLTMSDAVGAKTVEQFALFPIFGKVLEGSAVLTWSLYAYVLPLAPIVLVAWAWRRPERRAESLVVAGWAAMFGLLALMQLRYGNDATASVSVGFGLLGAWLVQLLRVHVGMPRAIAIAAVGAVGIAMFAPALDSVYLPWARRTLAALRANSDAAVPPLHSAAWSIHRFGVAVRAVTPETRGYAHPIEVPEYGIASHANLGHALQWVARRATPTDPFWEYIGPQNWDRAFGLLAAEREERAVELAHELGARYVVATPSASQGRIGDRLFRDDGQRRGRLPALRRFRLVTEGPIGGRPIQGVFASQVDRPADFVPYKLFEVVRGARLAIAAEPGALVEATLEVRTPAGRQFTYRTATRADDSGVARLRVPYSNARADAPGAAPPGEFDVVTEPAWNIAIGGEAAGTLFVAERAVRGGLVVDFAP